MKRLLAAALVVVGLALAIGLAVGLSMRPAPQRIYTPSPVRTMQAKPRPAVTVTGPPVIHYRDRTPGACRDAMLDADALLNLFAQYRDAASAQAEALLANDGAEVAKATDDLNRISARLEPDTQTYADDAAKCRGLERAK